MEKEPRIFRRTGLALGGIALVLLVVAATGYGLLQTRWARDQVAEIIADAIQPKGGTVEVGRLNGRLPFRIRLERVRVSDEIGPWLEIEDAALDWDPMSWLLQDRVDANRLLVKRVRLLRIPAASRTAEDSGSLFPSLPEFDISIHSLAIEDLELYPEIAGIESHFGAKGRLVSSRAGDLLLHLELQRNTRQDPTVRADIVYDRQADTLNIDVKARELAGGPWAHLLGWSDAPSWHLSVQGTGALDEWGGRLEAGVTDVVKIALDIQAEGSDPRQIRLSGDIASERAFDITSSEFLAPPFVLDVTFAFSQTGRVDISAGQITNPAGLLKLSGELDLVQETLDTAFAYRPTDPQRITRFIEPLTVQSVTLNGRLSGPLISPAVSMVISTGGMEMGAIQSGTAQISVTADGMASGKALPLSVKATLEEVSLARYEEAPLSLPSIQLDAQGSIDLEQRHIEINQAELTSSMATLRASGLVPLDRSASAPLKLTVDGELRRTPLEDPVLSALLEDPLKIRAVLGMPIEQDRYDLSEISIEHPLIQVMGSASLPVTPARPGWVDLSVKSLDLIAQRFDVPIRGGPVAILGELKPGKSGPQYTSRLTAADIRFKGVQFGPLSASITLPSTEQGQHGKLEAEFGGLPGPTVLTTDMRLRDEQGTLGLSAIKIRGAGLRLDGRLRLASFETPIEGEITGDFLQLTPWAALFDVPLEGAASLSVALEGIESRQQIRAQAVFRDLRSGGQNFGALAAESLTVSMSNADGADGTYSFDVRGEGASFGLARFEELALGGTTDFTATDFLLEAAGHYRSDLVLSAAGQLDITPDRTTLELSRLTGQILESEFALSEPAKLYRAANELGIDRLVMALGGGNISVSGHYGKDSINGHLQLRRARLRPLNLFLPEAAFRGTLSGEARIAASQTAHMAEMTFDVEALAASGYPEIAPIGGTVSGQWADGRAQVDINLSDDADSHFRAKGEAPLTYDPVSGVFSVPSAGPVTGAFSWRGEAGPVWDAFGSDAHQLRGTVEAEARLSGAAGELHASGTVRVRDGSYLNLDFGTVLREVEMSFEGSENEIVLKQATATDGASGTVSARGHIRLDPARKFPAEIELTAKNATLARAQAVTVKGDGTLNYTRQRGVALLKGTIKTSEIEALLVDLSSADIVDLEVVEIGGVDADSEAKPVEADEIIGRTDLDVTATVPRRAFIRGRGLDSEWRGQTQLTGTSDEPVLTGTFELVRGRFDFAGRNFRITRGSVEFRGGTEIDPWMDIESEYQDQDFRALAHVTGPASSPKIALSSEPELPQDEVMARILFGTSVSELGPVEALQLADAIRTLSSPGKKGILGKARGTLGLDVFRIGGNGNSVEGTTVAGGKYLTKNIYIEVERGLTGEEDKISVEVQLTPRISVESELMQDADSNIGIKWRKDY